MTKLRNLVIGDPFVMGVILLNTVAMFVQGFADDSHTVGLIAMWVDVGCVAFFIIEAILKVGAWGWRDYWVSGWNRLDLLVVVLSLPVLATPWLSQTPFEAVLLLRLGRLFRMFRLMRFIPDRDHLAQGIVRSLKASVGLLVALALVNVVLALGANMLFGEISPDHFGNPVRALYSMFKIFTIEGWYEVPDQMAAGVGGTMASLIRGYFVVAVLVGGILGVSLANAVFVDQMMLDNTDALEADVAAMRDQIRDLVHEVRGLRADLKHEPDGGSES